MHSKPSTSPAAGWRASLATYGVSALIVLTGIIVAFQFVKPAPPDHIRIAAGAQDGAYYRYANQYAGYLARLGIRLEVVETAGSLENLSLLDKDDSGVDLAIVQGGVAAEDDNADIYAIGSLFYEPIWILLQESWEPLQLNALKGKRIRIGPEGSGTRRVATSMLAANGVDGHSAELVEGDMAGSAELLLDGGLDALFMVASADSPLLRRLIASDEVGVGDLVRAPAYARIDESLSALDLPRGTLNLEHDIPPQAIRLIGTPASLVARSDLHPALVDLLIMAANEVHGRGGIFSQPGEFPSPQHTGLPLSPDAERHYEYGPPFLQRFMPFWAATLVDRLKVMLLPLIGLMFPLIKAMPPFVRWRIRSRIYRWYAELRAIDLASREAREDPEQLAHLNRDLDRIEEELEQVEVPLSYADQLYNLKLHIRLIREQLRASA